MSELIVIDDDSFKTEVLENKGIVVVDFAANWCSPCRSQLPIMKKFAAANADIKVCKIDVDDAPMTASDYQVKSIPYLMIFKNGMPVKTKIGLTSLTALEEMVKEVS